MNILAVESSCDETAVAVVRDGRTVLADAIASQVDMHTIYGGVVPEIASRAHIEAVTGITQEALALADQDIIIPMIGMVQSLNVSVASALILYEAQRQRQNAGMYLRENSMLPEAEQQRLLFEGGYPVLAKVAKRKGLPYPHVNQQGEIEADADWWSTMQAAG